MFESCTQEEKQQIAVTFKRRADGHLQKQNYEDCLADCNKVIQLDPAMINKHFLKALGLASSGDINEAIDVIKQGEQEDPGRSDLR